jgi:hypothetical protein
MQSYLLYYGAHIFNIQKLYLLPTHDIYVSHDILQKNSKFALHNIAIYLMS